VESLYLLIPVSIVLVFVIAGLFWWSVRSGQFDDLEGPAHRILMDSEPPTSRKNEEKGSKGEGATTPPRDRMPD
jgi:cbb3-type cytochrome oxidase maturation protein